MCKLAGWTASKNSPLTRYSADKAIIAAAKIIGRTERNGFGFAQSGDAGLRARFVKPEDFRSMDSLPSLLKLSGAGYAAFAASRRTEQTGYYNRNKSTIVHGRTATCEVNLTNTHPFRHDGWTLAHNGVVNWTGKQDKLHRKATCDSQHLLYALTENRGTADQMDAMKHITGYAAFLALSPRGKLIVAVDSMASLYGGITKKGRWIFGTTKEIVESIADSWGCKSVDAFAIDDWTWMEFAPRGGDPVVYKWSHGEATSRETRYAHASLGRSIGSITDTAFGSYRSSDYKFEKKSEGAYRTVEVPSGKYSGLAARSEDVGLTQHNLDDDLTAYATMREVDLTADVETEGLQGVSDYVPQSQRYLKGIV